MERVEKTQRLFKLGTMGLGLGSFVMAIATPKIRLAGEAIAFGSALATIGGLVEYPFSDEIEGMTAGYVSFEGNRFPAAAVALGGVTDGGWRWNRVGAIELAGTHPSEALGAAVLQEVLGDVQTWNILSPSTSTEKLAARISFTTFSAALVLKLAHEAADPDRDPISRQFAGYRLGRALNAFVATLQWNDTEMIQEADGRWIYYAWGAQQIMRDLHDEGLFDRVVDWFQGDTTDAVALIEQQKPST